MAPPAAALRLPPATSEQAFSLPPESPFLSRIPRPFPPAWYDGPMIRKAIIVVLALASLGTLAGGIASVWVPIRWTSRQHPKCIAIKIHPSVATRSQTNW